MKLFAIAVLAGILFGCNTQNKKSYSDIQDVSEDLAMAKTQEHPGKKLLENNCYVCHNPKTSEESLIAPPMVAVKMRYIYEETSKEEFINAMMKWAKKPSEENSKMPGAVMKYGLMPYQFFPEETIRQIADYMYENEIETPEWFGEHYNSMHGDRPMMKGKMGRGKGMGMNNPQTETDKKPSIEDRGMMIAQTTKAELGKNLMGQIQKNGVITALDFCNIQALPITDSMATIHKAHIRRVTDKPRNPKNKANATELHYLENFKKQVATGGEVKPITVQMGNETEFYYPIVTNSLCLKCHGTPGKELDIHTLSKIKKLYPNDKATGYNENEVRGIWSIQFEK